MPDQLTIAELKQVANSTPQPYAIQAQVDGALEKQTQQGKPYFELRLTDGSESLLWRVFDSNPAFEAVRQLPRGAVWVELSGLWEASRVWPRAEECGAASPDAGRGACPAPGLGRAAARPRGGLWRDRHAHRGSAPTLD